MIKSLSNLFELISGITQFKDLKDEFIDNENNIHKIEIKYIPSEKFSKSITFAFKYLLFIDGKQIQQTNKYGKLIDFGTQKILSKFLIEYLKDLNFHNFHKNEKDGELEEINSNNLFEDYVDKKELLLETNDEKIIYKILDDKTLTWETFEDKILLEQLFQKDLKKHLIFKILEKNIINDKEFILTKLIKTFNLNDIKSILYYIDKYCGNLSLKEWDFYYNNYLFLNFNENNFLLEKISSQLSLQEFERIWNIIKLNDFEEFNKSKLLLFSKILANSNFIDEYVIKKVLSNKESYDFEDSYDYHKLLRIYLNRNENINKEILSNLLYEKVLNFDDDKTLYENFPYLDKTKIIILNSGHYNFINENIQKLYINGSFRLKYGILKNTSFFNKSLFELDIENLQNNYKDLKDKFNYIKFDYLKETKKLLEKKLIENV